MDSATPTAALLSACRFVCSHADLDRLLPGLEFEIPVPQDLGGDLGVGWPVRTPPGLTSSFLEYVSATTKEALKLEPRVEAKEYFLHLESALFDAVAQAPGARLDTIVWLWLLDLLPRLLNVEPELFQVLTRTYPETVARHRGPLDQLARLGRSDPARQASLKRKIITTIDASHELVASELRQRSGESSEHLLALSSDTPLLKLVSPDCFYNDLDFAPVFSGRDAFVDEESFGLTRRLVLAIIDATWRRRVADRAGAGERWALAHFLPEALVTRAEALDPSILDAAAGDDLPTRIAALGSLQPDFVDYLLSHSDQFCVDPETAARYGLREDQIELLADPESLALRAPGYRDVVEELLRWDVINTARGFVRPVEGGAEGFLFRGLPVGAKVFVLDLEEGPSPPAASESILRQTTSSPDGQGLFGVLDAAFPEATQGAESPVEQPTDEYGVFGDLFSGASGFQGLDAPDQFEGGDDDHFDKGDDVAVPAARPEQVFSLLGVLEADFMRALQEYEFDRESLPPGGARGASGKQPDFVALFEDYMIFPVGRFDTEGSAIGIARPHRDQLFDLHLFPVSQDWSWGPDEAIDEFMRAKVRANFVPLAFEYVDIPEAAGAMVPLRPEQLERAFERVAHSDLEIS